MKVKRNILTIDEYGSVYFPNEVNNAIWMSINELLDLFDTITRH